MRRFISVLAICAMGVCAAPAAAQTTNQFKTFTLTVAPDRVEQGTEVEYTVTVRNVSKDKQTFGSANVKPPPDKFMLLGLESGPPQTAINTSTNTLELRHLTVEPGQSVIAVVRATTSTLTELGQHFWTGRAKQSRTFSESSNDWTLGGDATDRDTNVFSPPPPPPPPSDSCEVEGEGECTARHPVPDCWVDGFADESGPVRCAEPSDAVSESSSEYWVDTTVSGEDIRVGYLTDLTDQDTNFDSACDSPLTKYVEPSDAAAIFTGRVLDTVTFSLSPDLLAAIEVFQPLGESCFSAPYAFTSKGLDVPFFYSKTDGGLATLWHNGLLDDCSGLSVGACVAGRYSGDPTVPWVTISFPGVSPDPDPMNR